MSISETADRVRSGETRLISMAGWSMECCGTPFAVGEQVTLWVTLWAEDLERGGQPDLWAPLGELVTMVEDSHGDDAVSAVFGVRAVWGTYCRYEPGPAPRSLRPVAGSGELVEMAGTVHWAPARPGLTHCGYLIEVSPS